MHQRWNSLVPALAILLAGGLAHATASAKAPAIPQPAQPAVSAPTVVDDPLGRETPRGSFLAFVAAAQTGNLGAAAEYLQWPRHSMPITKTEAAEQLRFVLNHGFEGSIDQLSRDPQGSLSDTQPSKREKVGAVVLADGERVDIILTRIAPRSGPMVWVVAADTVAEIPRMYEKSGLPELERRLPKSLTSAQIGELPAWVPIALTVLLVALYFMMRLLLAAAAWLVGLIRRMRHRPGSIRRSRAWSTLVRPSAFLLTIALHRIIALRLGIPLLFRYYYDRLIVILLLAGLVWWLWRMVDFVADRVRERLQTAYPRTAQSAYVLGRRILKGVAFAFGLLIGLAAFGVNLSATLAGLGIGGIAIAFAAQKTLENVFGGIFVLSDRSLLVGDFCRLGQHVGEVEDVGLRTTSLRTLGRTLVHVPNGTLSTMDLENYSRRDKFLLNPTIALHYETSRTQLEQVLTSIRRLLSGDARIEADTSRARLVRFGSSSLDIEVFAYVRVPNFEAFLAVQEEILLGVMDIVQKAGTALAVPSQTMYVRQETAETPTPPAAFK
ncbi:MAG: mechanosensitive ion channel family protein [Acidobacteria bacterium]|nr:mechanosensitive ion channel family protein [Acidobacteriota bacterium]